MPEIEKMPKVLPDDIPTLPPAVEVLCGDPDCEEKHTGFATKADAEAAGRYLQAGLEKLLTECQVSAFCFSAVVMYCDGVQGVAGFEGPQPTIDKMLADLKSCVEVDYASGDN